MISFIIPTFNSENTIERTIESILGQVQTCLEYEIIVVDDGSTDNTKEIMQKYFNNEKVKYYYKENSGVADARNVGVNKSKGNYVIFVDSDDYISKTLLYDIEKYINNGIDIIKWNVTFVDSNKNEISKPNSIEFETTSGEDGFNKLFGKDDLIDCLWKYAFKKSLIIEFPSGTYHEDFATIPLMIVSSSTMVSIANREYYYVQSENSIMRNNDTQKEKKKIVDKLNHYDNLIEKSKSLKIAQKTKENIQIFATNSMLTVLKDLSDENKKYYIDELKKRDISKYIKARNLKQFVKKILIKLKY